MRFQLQLSTYHVQANDLTVGLLQLAELGHEVPEAGLGDNSVGRENPHYEHIRSVSQ